MGVSVSGGLYKNYFFHSSDSLDLVREAFIPRGGPDGGDGGKGGAVKFVANPSIKSLLNLKSIYRAPSGTNGKGRNCHGKNGKDIVIGVCCPLFAALLSCL